MFNEGFERDQGLGEKFPSGSRDFLAEITDRLEEPPEKEGRIFAEDLEPSDEIEFVTDQTETGEEESARATVVEVDPGSDYLVVKNQEGRNVTTSLFERGLAAEGGGESGYWRPFDWTRRVEEAPASEA